MNQPTIGPAEWKATFAACQGWRNTVLDRINRKLADKEAREEQDAIAEAIAKADRRAIEDAIARRHGDDF
jgi:hypothetical protein